MTVQPYKGGGIGGLMLGVAIGHMDREKLIEVDIYESSAELVQVGAGITVWPRALQILRNLGLEKTLASYQARPETKDEPRFVFKFRKSDQSEGVTFFEMTNGSGFHTIRKTPFNGNSIPSLLQHLPPNYRCHLSTRLTSYKETQEYVHLEFQNGINTTCDILVGADGIKSSVRKFFFQDNLSSQVALADPIWSGTAVYRGLIPSELLAKERPNHCSLSSPMIHIVTYPISQGRLVNVAAYYSEPQNEGTTLQGAVVSDVSKEEMLSKFEGWEDEVISLLKLIEKPSRWAIQTIKPLDKYASGRVMLLGDAAHAMVPHLGSGATQAVEDAYILATILSHAEQVPELPISRLSEIYTTVRQPVGNFVQNLSRTEGLLYEFNAPICEDIKELDSSIPQSRLVEIGEEVAKAWEWLWTSSAEPDRVKAEEMVAAYNSNQTLWENGS
ncbi:FAD/NAD(P)-binding domain-containing protein [Crucibulum laeve]|uniref:FAD/NAD(P)-binding domain-containing protein n=1 Tax=Crucibulum laeve TaxID=68775 RepID=A0A5C3LSR0_9AGAR|nr:FAD/NAD(P)-binding domain-containing protein [Crucibulum laeve]